MCISRTLIPLLQRLVATVQALATNVKNVIVISETFWLYFWVVGGISDVLSIFKPGSLSLFIVFSVLPPVSAAATIELVLGKTFPQSLVGYF